MSRLDLHLKNSNNRIVMTKKEITKLNFPVIQRDRPGMVLKPEGLWYGFGDSWVKWVKSEMPEWMGTHFYNLEVNENKLLQLSSVQDIVKFTEKFTEKYGYSGPIDYAYIMWSDVAKEYSGIEIKPYIHQLRNKYIWYSGWDVASGCIWNKSAIKSFEMIEYEIW